MSRSSNLVTALIILAVLQIIMIGALFTETAPHPPLRIALFALGPWLGAAVAICCAAAWSVTQGGGRALSALAAIMATLSYGPQKYFDAAFPEIWPAVLTAQGAIICILWVTLAPLVANLSQKRAAT
ncbi:MAG: hypothetical protein ACPGGK_14335 [Pikeienuella sp.]